MLVMPLAFSMKLLELLLLVRRQHRLYLSVEVLIDLLRLVPFLLRSQRSVVAESHHVVAPLVHDRFHFGLLVRREVQLLAELLEPLLAVFAHLSAAILAIAGSIRARLGLVGRCGLRLHS